MSRWRTPHEETLVSKSHPEQWTVREVAERPDRSLVTALREFATTQIADCGGPVAIVGPPLRHLAGGAQLCGPAVTVWTKPGDILYVLKAADLVAAGDVLVVDGGGRPDAAVIGDIAGQALAHLGCDGLVVDGAVRDLDGLEAAGLPTFAVGAHPATGSLRENRHWSVGCHAASNAAAAGIRRWHPAVKDRERLQ
jgi:4-hydroxy-4-methyl-2-oxoglutarate aldolase